MHVTSRLLQQCRITLFTRKHCGLCIAARSVLSDVWDTRPFAFKEVDIVLPESQAWKDLYDFDVPVVWLTGIASFVFYKRLTLYRSTSAKQPHLKSNQS